MKARDTVSVSICGHDIRLEAEPGEKLHIERAAAAVSERLNKLSARAASSGASPSKVATMVAFQFAFDLSMADDELKEMERLREELDEQKESAKRLEGLVEKLDAALAY